MVGRSVLNVIIVLVSLALFYFGVVAVEKYVNIALEDQNLLVGIIQAIFMAIYYILIPIINWIQYLGSPERRAAGFYMEIFRRSETLNIAISQIFRPFFSGRLTLLGLAYRLDKSDGFLYVGGWSSSNLIITTTNGTINVSYVYSGFYVDIHGIPKEESPGITQMFLRPEERGSGFFCDLVREEVQNLVSEEIVYNLVDEGKVKMVKFTLTKLRLADLLEVLRPKPLTARIMKLIYPFRPVAFMKGTEWNRKLLNVWRDNDWQAPWSDHWVRGAVLRGIRGLTDGKSGR
jgi:hypothetical protein